MHDAIIQAEGLVKAFGGKVRALDGLTLTVQRGGIHGLLGPNGAGKTTLIRILATLLPPDAGTARIGGVDVRTNPAAVRAQIGLAGQSAAVDDYLTGQENAEMIGRLYGLPHPQARRRAARCWSASTWRGWRTGRSRPTPAGYAAAWTWPRPWSAAPRCCSWTSPPPAWTPPAATTCGR